MSPNCGLETGSEIETATFLLEESPDHTDCVEPAGQHSA